MVRLIFFAFLLISSFSYSQELQFQREYSCVEAFKVEYDKTRSAGESQMRKSKWSYYTNGVLIIEEQGRNKSETFILVGVQNGWYFFRHQDGDVVLFAAALFEDSIGVIYPQRANMMYKYHGKCGSKS